MRAAVLAQRAARSKPDRNQRDGMPMVRLKSGADKHREENRSRRAEIFALPALNSSPIWRELSYA
jgi:hypothetical protein